MNSPTKSKQLSNKLWEKINSFRDAYSKATIDGEKELYLSLMKEGMKIENKIEKLQAYELLQKEKQIKSWTEKIEFDLALLQVRTPSTN